MQESEIKKGMLRKNVLPIIVVLAGLLLASLFFENAEAKPFAQQPTGSIATVTGTPPGFTVTVGAQEDQINVRSGPGLDFPLVGILVAGQIVPALGRSPGGDWVQIVYPGVPGGTAWVYSFLLIEIPSGTLPIVAPPPTPTPRTTPTVDPTLAAQFRLEATPTRLPTFTPPPPLVIPTFEAQGGGIMETAAAGIPMGLLIVASAVIGFFGAAIAILRR